MNAGRIKLLADRVVHALPLQCETATERDIANKRYYEAHQTLHVAIDELEAKIKDAFYAGYTTRNINEYLLDSEVDKEWKKYNES